MRRTVTASTRNSIRLLARTPKRVLVFEPRLAMAHVAPASSAAAPSETNRLETTFADSPVAAHGPRWHGLWKDSFTPWDRGGCSLALADTLISRPDLFPSRSSTARRERALVPGCGRGHDVLLLAALGYDVVGLDFSTAAIQAAQENARTPENVALYTAMGDTVKGDISWIAGDFFSDEWWSSVGKEPFHLIFDYTVSFMQPSTMHSIHHCPY